MRKLSYLFMVCILLTLSFLALGAESAEPVGLMAMISAGLVSLAVKFPVIYQIAVIMGICRIIFKPLFTFAHAVADATVTTKDNEFISKLEKSAVYRAIVWVLDAVASIKLIKPAKK